MPARRELANAIRALSMDAVQQANSGHPGMPMGMADIAEVLWNDYLRHNPANPAWPDRDRFVLSNGHGSMLLYSLLHLTGYDLDLERTEEVPPARLADRRATPRCGEAPGVETTTGPLGQGLANGVGMALAEKALAARFNRDDHPVVDHWTYVFAGDGCLMEGISHEACSLAGTQGLGKLVVFYDDNGISIDGEVDNWFTDDTPGRFAAYGWHVVPGVDGHDPEAVRAAIDAARAETGRPSIICCKTVIGWGSPNKHGSAEAHGAALGDDEVALVRERIGWQHPPFVVPDALYAGWDARAAGAEREAEWNTRLAAYREAHPELAAELERRLAGALPADWAEHAERLLRDTQEHGDKAATRKHSQAAITGFAEVVPELLGGSADLTGSNNTRWKGATDITADHADGGYVYYGVREFAMSAIVNGLALHGGFKPYAGTFLTFSDYARNAVRMSALMRIPSIFVYTHDSIGLGEDGPTHQAVEHLSSLRLIPRMELWRPCDAVETVAAWRRALEKADGPVAMAYSRQGVPHQARDAQQLADIARGGYILVDSEGEPDVTLIATGSEVQLAVERGRAARRRRASTRASCRCPAPSAFDAQDAGYRERVLPPGGRRVAIEAGVTDWWRRYVGLEGGVVGIDTFGESAPSADVMAHFGFTVDHVVETAKQVVGETRTTARA
ncbi:MAG: transketolase [Halofilum sp. (in: g-proteobacteria)]|nr:transketolase [Halofilum sp. (in: g-proteobacteria)]